MQIIQTFRVPGRQDLHRVDRRQTGPRPTRRPPIHFPRMYFSEGLLPADLTRVSSQTRTGSGSPRRRSTRGTTWSWRRTGVRPTRRKVGRPCIGAVRADRPRECGPARCFITITWRKVICNEISICTPRDDVTWQRKKRNFTVLSSTLWLHRTLGPPVWSFWHWTLENSLANTFEQECKIH